MASDQIIVVRAGYGSKGMEPEIWGYLHFHPTTDVKLGTVKLAYVDFYDHKLRVWNKWPVKRAQKTPTSPDSEKDLEPKVDIRGWDGSVTADDPKPSVLALYSYVKEQPQGSIRAMHVFSHSDEKGQPAIWNSYERFTSDDTDIPPDDLTLERDPHDTDCRRRDFVATNPLSGAEGTRFRAAFAPTAFVKLWGCSSDDAIRDQVRQVARMKDKKSERYRAKVEAYLEILGNGFAMRLARLLNTTVWSAPIGWGSDPSFGKDLKYAGRFPPDLDRDRWWQVPYFRKAGPERALFKTFGAPIDPLSYVGYHTRWYDDACRRFAARDSTPSPVMTPRDLQDVLRLPAETIE